MTSENDPLEQALASLPHGPGFRFVDALSRLEPGRHGEGRYLVRGDEWFLAAHFPGEPLFPGVLLVEAVAQLAGMVAQSDPEHARLYGLKLAALQNVKILGTARPGETIALSAEVTHRMGGLVQVQGQVRVGERLLLQASLTLAGTLP